jgi:hypothetical protein
MRYRVERRGVAVAGFVRRGEHLGDEALDLAECIAGGLGVDLGEGAAAEAVLGAKNLEQIELDVAQVASVVRHLGSPGGPGYW